MTVTVKAALVHVVCVVLFVVTVAPAVVQMPSPIGMPKLTERREITVLLPRKKILSNKIITKRSVNPGLPVASPVA